MNRRLTVGPHFKKTSENDLKPAKALGELFPNIKHATDNK